MLDDLGKSNLTRWALKNGRQKQKHESERCNIRTRLDVAGFEKGGRRPLVRKCGSLRM